MTGDDTDISAQLRFVTMVAEIRGHLVKAQELMDAIDPDSIFGARLQQLIDELDGPADPQNDERMPA